MNTKAIVLKEIPLKEEDKIVVVFSREYGKISIYAKGARKTKSAYLAGTQMLTYSDFFIYKKENLSSLSKIDIIDSFLDIKNDYEKLYMAMYFLEYVDSLIIEDNPNEELFDFLILTLDKMKKSNNLKLMKPIFEMRALGLAGYMPNVLTCQSCGNELDEDCRFSSSDDGVICESCSGMKKGIKISKTTLYTLKYIFYIKQDKIYTFSVDDKYKKELKKVSDDYKNLMIDKPLKSEKFILD